MDRETRRHEEDWGEEEQLLYAWGFHRLEVAGEEFWQLGRAGATDVKKAELYTREQALDYVEERMHED